MKLLWTIPLSQVKLSREEFLKEFEGFTLIWGKDSLKIYKQVR